MVQRSEALAQLRAGADPVVWANVSRTMRGVEARDSIVFRTGDVGRGWLVAARALGAATLVWTVAQDRRRRRFRTRSCAQ